MLEQIEVGPPGFVQCDNLTINNGVIREISQSFEDERILPVEGIPPPGKKIQLAGGFYGNGAISIEFDLVHPL